MENHASAHMEVEMTAEREFAGEQVWGGNRGGESRQS